MIIIIRNDRLRSSFKIDKSATFGVVKQETLNRIIMKNMAYLCLLLIGLSVQAQDLDQLRDQDRIREYLLLQDNELLRVRDQDRIRLSEQTTLPDGSVVNPDGTYRDAEGVRQRLRDGECLDLDGNKYSSQEQFQQHLQYRLQAMNQMHFAFQDGKTTQLQNGKATQLRERTALQNGGWVYTDGSFELPGQPPLQLREGQVLDPDGNMYRNQSQFLNTARLRLQANEQEHFAFENGNMLRIQDMQQSQLQQQYRLENGLTVNPDGSYQFRDQERIQLRDGECLDGEGNVYASRQQLREQAQVRLHAMNQEHFIHQDGQVYQVLNQERTRLTERVNLQNGLVINPDGTYRMKNKRQQNLANGECLDQEGNRYQTQTELNQRYQNRFMAMLEPHFFFQNGKLYRSQNQVQVQVKGQWRLENGAVITPNGTYQLNGKKEQLKNGESVDREGNRYENRDRFREKMELQLRERKEVRDREIRERRPETRRRISQ